MEDVTRAREAARTRRKEDKEGGRMEEGVKAPRGFSAGLDELQRIHKHKGVGIANAEAVAWMGGEGIGVDMKREGGMGMLVLVVSGVVLVGSMLVMLRAMAQASTRRKMWKRRKSVGGGVESSEACIARFNVMLAETLVALVRELLVVVPTRLHALQGKDSGRDMEQQQDEGKIAAADNAWIPLRKALLRAPSTPNSALDARNAIDGAVERIQAMMLARVRHASSPSDDDNDNDDAVRVHIHDITRLMHENATAIRLSLGTLLSVLDDDDNTHRSGDGNIERIASEAVVHARGGRALSSDNARHMDEPVLSSSLLVDGEDMMLTQEPESSSSLTTTAPLSPSQRRSSLAGTAPTSTPEAQWKSIDVALRMRECVARERSNRLSEAELSVRLEALSVASRSNDIAQRQYRQHRRQLQLHSMRDRLIRFRAACADDMCVGVVVMVLVMVVNVGSGGGGFVLGIGGQSRFREAVQDCYAQARRSSSLVTGANETAIGITPSWLISTLLWPFVSLRAWASIAGSLEYAKCAGLSAMEAVGGFIAVLLLAVFVHKSISASPPGASRMSGAGAALGTPSNVSSAMPISNLIVFNGLVCGKIGSFVVANVMGGSGEVWMAAWVLMMTTHALAVWKAEDICSAIDSTSGSDLDDDDNDEYEYDAARLDTTISRSVPSRFPAPLIFPLMFHTSLGLLLPVLVGLIPFYYRL